MTDKHMTAEDANLCEVLTAKFNTGRLTMGGGVIDSKGSGRIWGGEPIFELRNPNGPTAAARIRALSAEAAELRAERDALLQKPLDMAKLDSIDDGVPEKMLAYYWLEQAQDARKQSAELRGHAEAMAGALTDCAADLGTEIKARTDHLRGYPTYDRKRDADLEPVRFAYQALTAWTAYLAGKG